MPEEQSNLVSETTRYLAATAYLSRKFRTQVLDKIEYRVAKGLAPEVGVDMPTVIHHCRRARRWTRIRDVIMVLVWVYILWQTILIAVVNEIIVFPDALPFAFEWLVNANSGELAIAAGVAVAVTLIQRFLNQNALLHEMAPGMTKWDSAWVNGDPSIPMEYRNPEKHNLIAYASFNPFVGSGIPLGGWSTALRHDKTPDNPLQDKGTAENFDIEELYARVERDVKDLGIENLTVRHLVFCRGDDMRAFGYVPAKALVPAYKLDDDDVKAIRVKPSTNRRHYIAFTIADWRGELVFTQFFRAERLRTDLFLEATQSLLTPFVDKFKKVDKLESGWRLGTLLRLLSTSILLAPLYFLMAPVRLYLMLVKPIQAMFANFWARRRVRRNPSHNFGVAQSLREAAASPNYQVYFQRLDFERNAKIIERQLLDTLIVFLKEHNIDTAALSERGTTIQNNGVMISGNASLSTDNLAVGQNAKNRVAGLFGGRKNDAGGKKAA